MIAELVVWLLGSAGCAVAWKSRKPAVFTASTGWAFICIVILAVLRPDRRSFGDIVSTFVFMWAGGWILKAIATQWQKRSNL